MIEHKQFYRSALGQAKGLGAAHSGTHHWWLQRLTAMALIPCGIWLLYALIYTQTLDYDDLVAWLAYPINATLMLTTVWTGLYHSVLGVQVVIEDYVHHHLTKIALITAVKIKALLLAVAALVAVFSCIGANA